VGQLKLDFIPPAIPQEIKNPVSELETGFFAERMGFEPTITFWAIHTFQACSFDHSDTSLNVAAKIELFAALWLGCGANPL
jgi:hypothetical protein